MGRKQLLAEFISERKKGLCAGHKQFSFCFVLLESEQVCRWEGENPWTGKTEDGSLIVELDT